jgi:hypothetical protein
MPAHPSRQGCLRRRSQSAALVVGDREVGKATILTADVAATLPFTRVSAGSQAPPRPDRLPHPAVAISAVQSIASSCCSFRGVVPIVASHGPQPLRSSWRAHGRKRETWRASNRAGPQVKARLPRAPRLAASWGASVSSGPKAGSRPQGRRTTDATPIGRAWRWYGGCGTTLILADEPMGWTRQRASASLRFNRCDTSQPVVWWDVD